MKILHLIQTSGPGGAEKLLLTLVNNSKNNFESIVGLIKNGWLYEQLQSKGVKVQIIPSGGSFDVKFVKNLITFIKKEKVDIVHSHLLDMNFYSSIASKLSGIIHISTEHGDIHHISKKVDKKTRIKAKLITKFSDKIVFVSRFTRDKYLEIANVPEEKTAIIYNGIDLDEYKKPVDIKKKKVEIGIDEEDYVVGNVANLYPVKGQTFLLKAARMVRKEIPKARFLIIGRGELEGDLKNEALNLGIDSHVKFLGFREDVRELLRIMDVFVLPSLSEGLPLSLIEAMASQVPVVAAKVGGIPEVIDDGLNGFLIAPYDQEAIAKKIILLISNLNLRRKFSNNGFQKVIENFEINNMINKYKDIYHRFYIK